MHTLGWVVVGCVLAVSGCDQSKARVPEAGTPLIVEVAPVVEGNWYRPSVGNTWQWQLQAVDDQPLNTRYEADIYNVDLFDTPMSTIESLRAKGRRVICYFSAGSFENYREDRSRFRESDLGKVLDGWPQERWVDIRSSHVHRVMSDRLDLAAQKGCDGVEPDNVQGYLEDTGFELTAEDQLAYNRFIANEARRRGLAVGLKNALEQVPELIDYFDFSINEQCFQFNECHLLRPFIEAGKPVLTAEYPADDEIPALDDRSITRLCNAANSLRFSTLILPVNLDDSFRIACWEWP